VQLLSIRLDIEEMTNLFQFCLGGISVFVFFSIYAVPIPIYNGYSIQLRDLTSQLTIKKLGDFDFNFQWRIVSFDVDYASQLQ